MKKECRIREQDLGNFQEERLKVIKLRGKNMEASYIGFQVENRLLMFLIVYQVRTLFLLLFFLFILICFYSIVYYYYFVLHCFVKNICIFGMLCVLLLYVYLFRSLACYAMLEKSNCLFMHKTYFEIPFLFQELESND